MRDAAIAVAIALFVTFSVCGYISFREGVAWGQAHQPVRLVPISEVIRQNDACVCAPTIFRGTRGDF